MIQKEGKKHDVFDPSRPSKWLPEDPIHTPYMVSESCSEIVPQSQYPKFFRFADDKVILRIKDCHFQKKSKLAIHFPEPPQIGFDL